MRWSYFKGENGAERDIGIVDIGDQVAVNESRSCIGIIQENGNLVTDTVDDPASHIPSQDQQSEYELHHRAPNHRFPNHLPIQFKF